MIGGQKVECVRQKEGKIVWERKKNTADGLAWRERADSNSKQAMASRSADGKSNKMARCESR